jgi:hypothetical protein
MVTFKLKFFFARLENHNNNTYLHIVNTLSTLNSLQHNYCKDINLTLSRLTTHIYDVPHS